MCWQPPPPAPHRPLVCCSFSGVALGREARRRSLPLCWCSVERCLYLKCNSVLDMSLEINHHSVRAWAINLFACVSERTWKNRFSSTARFFSSATVLPSPPHSAICLSHPFIPFYWKLEIVHNIPSHPILLLFWSFLCKFTPVTTIRRDMNLLSLTKPIAATALATWEHQH